MTLGQRLRTLRLAHGVSAAEAANRANLTVHQLYDWEVDSTVPRVTLLARVAATYGISVAELLEPVKFDLPAAVQRRRAYRHLLDLALRGLVPDARDVPDDTPLPESSPL